MNKKILYKLLLIFAFLSVVLLIGCTNSFASDETIIYDSIDLTFSTGKSISLTNQKILSYKNILILHSYENDYYNTNIYFSNEGAFSFAPRTSNAGFELACVDENLNPVTFYGIYSVKTGYYYSSGIEEINNATSFREYKGDMGSNTIYSINSIEYSSYDVLSYDLENDVATSDILVPSTTGNGSFFQPPPQVQEQVATLAPIVEEVEAKKTLAEVEGILPLIIVVVVSLVGLRKALKMLLAVLHRA